MNLSKLLLLICTTISSIAYGQIKSVNSRNDIPGGWVVTGMTCQNLNCTYVIQNISGARSEAEITVVPVDNTVPGGWQVIGISGTDATNIKWTIKKTAGMRKGIRINVCNLNFINSEWKMISQERCGSCAFLGASSGDCWVIEKITEGNAVRDDKTNPTPTSPIVDHSKPIIRSMLIPGINPYASAGSPRGGRGGPLEPRMAMWGPSTDFSPGSTVAKTYGRISFYSRLDWCGFKIYINGRYMGRTIYYFLKNIDPTCLEPQAFTAYLPAGTYTCRVVSEKGSAAQNAKSIDNSFNITINAGDCIVREIFEF